MKLEQLINELQERNKGKINHLFEDVLEWEGRVYEAKIASSVKSDQDKYREIANDELKSDIELHVQNFTTDTAHQVALAVIGEIKREIGQRIDEWEASEDWDGTLNDGLYSLGHYLTTLEEALQDNK